MTRFLDLTGRQIGLWNVTGRVYPVAVSKGAHWHCVCACGESAVVQGNNLRAKRSTACYSCGRAKAAKQYVTHGGTGSRLFGIWCGMHKRCRDLKDMTYGGKGVRVCDEWAEFPAFQTWALSHGYADDLTIERKRSSGNYEPSNCEWLTKSENSRRAMQDRWGAKETPDGHA